MNDNVLSIAGKGTGSDLLLALPKAPTHMSKDAQKGYKMMGDLLITAKRLKSIFLPTLEVFADAYAQWQWVLTEINRKNRHEPGSGYIQTFPNGTSNVSPEMTLKRMAVAQMLECCKLFGLDPKSDKELKAVGDPNQKNLFDELRAAIGN
jgi:P27 family predicted phage terminase small subunit